MKKIPAFIPVVSSPLLLSLLYFAKPPVPQEWRALKKGNPFSLVKSKIPELENYDATMFTAARDIKHLGITFFWTIYVHFGEGGKLESINRRSRNDWTGVLDSYINM